MDKQGWLGAIIGALGITAGAAVSAYLSLYPEAAGFVWRSGLAISVTLLIAGVIVMVWPRPQRPKSSEGGITVKMGDGNSIGRIGNDRHGR